MVGPWSDVSIRPYLEAAIDLNLGKKLDEEKARLESQAKDAVRSKLADELDVTDTGQDLEDAAKQKLEDEVKRGLLKLFD
jgi:AsmA protein